LAGIQVEVSEEVVVVLGKMTFNSLRTLGLILFIILPIWSGCSIEMTYQEYKDKIEKLYERERYEKSLALMEEALGEYNEGFERGILLLMKGRILTEYYLPEDDSVLCRQNIEKGISAFTEATAFLEDSLFQLRSCYFEIVKNSIFIGKIDRGLLEDNRKFDLIDSLCMMRIFSKDTTRKYVNFLYHNFAAEIHFALHSPQDSVIWHINKAIEESPDNSITQNNFIEKRRAYLEYFDSK
jgi:tetratricopeptide (TPR) repeat protein